MCQSDRRACLLKLGTEPMYTNQQEYTEGQQVQKWVGPRRRGQEPGVYSHHYSGLEGMTTSLWAWAPCLTSPTTRLWS